MDENKIEPSVYRYILKHTKKQQIILLLLTLTSMPFVYAGLEIPKIIINSALGGVNIPDQILGFDINQIQFLAILCFTFLFLVLINGGLKYVNNIYRGVLGEQMLRRFRYDLFSRLLRFPIPRFKQVSQGEIIPMVTAETEPLGGFIGDAFALPAFQGGLLLTYLFFIFNQDVWLGLAAIALYPPQLYIIPKLQRRVNELAKKRVQAVRKFADKVGESVSGISDIHANDTSHYEKAHASDRLGTIYHIRYDIYKKKFFIKFLNNFLSQLTPFFFFGVGGYFVIQGELSLGALVAVLAAYKDLDAPWKELLKFYQITEDVRVKYAQIISQFQPENMLKLELQSDQDVDLRFPEATLQGSSISYSEDEFVKSLDGVSFSVEPGQHIGLLGPGGSGKGELTQLVTRLLHPGSGRIKVADYDIGELSESVLGRRLAYVDQQSYVFTGTIRENLLYGIKNRPLSDFEYSPDELENRKKQVKNSILSENSTDDINSDWLNTESAGFESRQDFNNHLATVLDITGLDDDVYQLGLYSTINTEDYPELATGILEARQRLRQELQKEEFKPLVEILDNEKYNTNLSAAENLILGVPTQTGVELESLLSAPVVVEAIAEAHLKEPLFRIGLQTTKIMVEIFADVPEGSPMFERFNFIQADELPVLAGLSKLPEDVSIESLSEQDAELVTSLSFKLIVSTWFDYSGNSGKICTRTFHTAGKSW
jgi:ABC-type multidrug transport system fused ATPase/permease subunit